MKWSCFIFIGLLTFGARANSLTMSVLDAIHLAGDLVERGDFTHAEQILTMLPVMDTPALEVERSFLLAQIAQSQGNLEDAIKIYNDFLDMYPDLARVRFELARVYMNQNKWHRADYHLRLAMAGNDLSDSAKATMNYMRYLVRQNKNWNIWFNMGVAPDNNVNNATGGTECVNTIFGPMCRELEKPESAVGTNISFGGDYEFKLNKNLRWKNSADIYLNAYDVSKYDDFYLGVSTGPRYVFGRGSIWTAGTFARRYYGWEPYMYSYGMRVIADYDVTRRLTLNGSYAYSVHKYDYYAEFMNADVWSGNLGIVYSIDASKYIVLRGGVARHNAVTDVYSSWQPMASIGFGAELPYGFSVYLEPCFYWVNYEGPTRWVVTDGAFREITERDFTGRYSIRLSNNKFDVWGFVPTLTYAYTHRESNIWQREFGKHSIEFTMLQRF